jgi:flagellar M-ring protein FliF
MQQVLAQLTAFWRGLNAAQRIALVAVGLIIAGALALLVSLGGRPEYATLFANLDPADAAKVVDALESQRVPHRLTHAGTAVQVPVERVYDLRLELASQGLPASGPVGFEAFDEAALGATPFQERVRFRRALEGELARTISQLEPVHWTRVHINLPERKVFQREAAKPSASVVVSLRSGQMLSGGEIKGIGHLVAGAVEGLSVDQVTIVDTRGRLLARAGAGSDEDALAADVLDVQRALEQKLSARAQDLLDAALGPGTSVVTVAAALDRRSIEENQDRINPDESAVLSEQTTEESRTEPGPTTSGGVAGAAANVPGGPGGETNASGTAREEITRTTTNFEVTRTRSRTVTPMGEIERLSVAVLVDGTYEAPAAEPGTEGAEPAAGERTYKPRSAEDLTRIAEIVKRAVGFNEQRGDAIEVQNLPFHSPLEDVAAPAPSLWERPELFALLPGLSRTLAVLLGVCLLIFLVIRPALKQLTLANIVTASAASGVPIVPGEAGTPEPVARLVSEADKLRQQLAAENPKLVADALKQLLRE